MLSAVILSVVRLSVVRLSVIRLKVTELVLPPTAFCSFFHQGSNSKVCTLKLFTVVIYISVL